MRKKNKRILLIFLLTAIVILTTGCRGASGPEAGLSLEDPDSGHSSEKENWSSEGTFPEETKPESGSHIDTLSYQMNYQGTEYEKKVSIFVPSVYDGSEPMNILYLMHGSTGSGEETARVLQPLFDRLIDSGVIEPVLVVFPTYYPDHSFVVADYTEDYPLNHFFATDEVMTVVRAVEGKYHTYAENTDDESLTKSRFHRAFGGYSMGAVTTWDVLACQARYFAYYLPMAGDCWLDQAVNVSSDDGISDLLIQGLKEGGYSSDDFRIIAMVGGNDVTKYSMQPQIEALRKNHPEIITDENLIYWENEDGRHSLESFEAELEHGMPMLWTLNAE